MNESVTGCSIGCYARSGVPGIVAAKLGARVSDAEYELLNLCSNVEECVECMSHGFPERAFAWGVKGEFDEGDRRTLRERFRVQCDRSSGAFKVISICKCMVLGDKAGVNLWFWFYS